MSLSLPSSSSRLTLLLAGVFAVVSLASTSSMFGQGYQIQGYTPQPIPNAYQQMGHSVPVAGAGLQPQAAPATNYRVQQPYQQQQFTRQPSQQSLMPGVAYGGNPAYQQLPATPRPKTPKPLPAPSPYGAQPYFPTDSDAPMPYPSSSQVPGAQPQPKPADNAKLAADIAALRNNDRIQDSRLDNLEHRQRGIVAPAVAQPVQTTRLTYVKHQVRARESIWGIADRYGVTADDIRKTNNRSNDFITEGEVLYVPQRVPASTNSLVGINTKSPRQPTKSSNGTHIVQRGETLSSIAASYRVSAKSLQSANSISNANVIALGQKLTIPGSSNVARTTQQVSTTSKSQRAVATAPKAAAKPAETVVKAPEPPPPGAGTATGSVIKPFGQRGITSYRVELGDNIDSVAKTFGTSPAELRRINRVDKLPATGEEIAVPLPGSVAL